MGDNKASAKIERKHAFIIDDQAITSLWKIFSDCGMTVEAAIKCSNNVVMNYANKEQLLEYPNEKSARIKSLEITGKRDSSGNDVSLNFGEDSLETISGSISCDPPELNTVKDQVSQVLEDIRPRYSVFATFSEIGLMVIVMSVVLAVSGYTLRDLARTTPQEATKKVVFTSAYATHVALVMLGIVIAMFAIPFCVQKVREYLFPKHIFALGEGKLRHDSLVKFRWAILWGGMAVAVIGLGTALAVPHL